MGKKLKPCPFCGSMNIRKPIGEDGWMCKTCGSKGFVDWNTRPIEDALEARVAELEAENAELKGRAENAEQMVSRLLEVGSALEAQAYDAWIKDGMLDFPAAKDWELLINEIKETKKESEK